MEKIRSLTDEYWKASSRLMQMEMKGFDGLNYEKLQDMLHKGDLGSEMESLAKTTIDELWKKFGKNVKS